MGVKVMFRRRRSSVSWPARAACAVDAGGAGGRWAGGGWGSRSSSRRGRGPRAQPWASAVPSGVSKVRHQRVAR